MKRQIKVLIVINFLAVSVSFAGMNDIIFEDGNLNLTENFFVDTNTLFVDSANNRVGIGTISPNQTLDMCGNAFITSLDRDLKDNIIELNVSNLFNSLRLYSYQVKKDVSGNIELKPVQIGLMQDEVLEECRKGEGVDTYCLLGIIYVNIADGREDREFRRLKINNIIEGYWQRYPEGNARCHCLN